MSRPPFERLFLAALALASIRCSVSPTVRAAEQGRFEGLRDALSARLAQGKLPSGEAERFAKAIAKGEIDRASGAEGIKRLHELEPCAREIDGVLGDRASTRDDIGAAAALMLVDAGVSSAWHYDRWLRTPPDAPEAAWRALGARTVTSGSDGPLRRQLIADPDEEVRRSALHAALVAADPEDTEAVLEAARVDPSPAARAEALRAAGALGGERVVAALKDLWPRAEDSVRETIIEAWASRPTFETGGRGELGWVVDTQRGVPVMLAAVKLVSAGGAGSAEATGALERAVKDGPTADRLRAIDLVPFDIPSLREALSKAETDPDEAVAAAAMGRRLEAPAKKGGAGSQGPARDALVAKLLPLASGNGAGAPVARATLARAKVSQVVPILEKNGTAADPSTRLEAGRSLAAAGDLPRAAVVAADPEPHVRIAVACAILHPESPR